MCCSIVKVSRNIGGAIVPLAPPVPPPMLKLTLTALSLFSNTGDSIAYILATVHFLYPKLGSFSDMEYHFYQLVYWDSKVPKRFVGLNQMQCSPSFDWNFGKKMTPLHVGTSYTHDFRIYSKL